MDRYRIHILQLLITKKDLNTKSLALDIVVEANKIEVHLYFCDYYQSKKWLISQTVEWRWLDNMNHSQLGDQARSLPDQSLKRLLCVCGGGGVLPASTNHHHHMMSPKAIIPHLPIWLRTKSMIIIIVTPTSTKSSHWHLNWGLCRSLETFHFPSSFIIQNLTVKDKTTDTDIYLLPFRPS